MSKSQIYVKNIEQKILWDEELIGQFSDGLWENSKNRSWKDLNTTANIDTKNPRLEENGNFIKPYNTVNKQLLHHIGFRMLGFARTAKLFQEVPNSYHFSYIIEDLFNKKLTKENLNREEKEIIGISQDKHLKNIKFTKEDVLQLLNDKRINELYPETIKWCKKNIDKLLKNMNRKYYIKNLLKDLQDIKKIMENNYIIEEKQEQENKYKEENNLELN